MACKTHTDRQIISGKEKKMMTAVKVVTWTRDQQQQQSTTDQKPVTGEEGKREGMKKTKERMMMSGSQTQCIPCLCSTSSLARTSVCACVCLSVSERGFFFFFSNFFDYLLQTLVLVWAEIIIICEKKVPSAQEKREKDTRRRTLEPLLHQAD